MDRILPARSSVCCRPGDRAVIEDARRFTPLCRVLGDETRLGIFGLLLAADGPLCVCEIEACFELSQPTISHHLRSLREADLVVTERRGNWIHYSLAPAGVDLAVELGNWLGRAAVRKGRES